jgi:hypothetical protein
MPLSVDRIQKYACLPNKLAVNYGPSPKLIAGINVGGFAYERSAPEPRKMLVRSSGRA